MWLLLLLALTTQAASTVRPPSQKRQRLPLQKKKIILESPTNYEKRIVRHDPKTEKPVYYDPRPRVVLLDAKSGKYALQWIGYDGEEKTIIYQRPDAIDAVASASVLRTPSGQYIYEYNIQNLATSGQHLSGFAVQNFTSDVKPVKIDNVHVGQMSSNKEMKGGNWIRFGISPDFKPAIVPGRNIEFRLMSSAPPGLVECRIHGGVLGMKGVGEEPPQELENVLPGYEAWPSGYTIGPSDHLEALSPAERANYIFKLLPQFRRLGWMTANALRWYEQNLKRNDLGVVYKRAEQDLKKGNITTEVFGIIQSTLN
jgi:hypothetical protein